MLKVEPGKLSDMEIAQMFSDYVERMDARPRHTGAAIKESEGFDTMLESEFPRNIRLQTIMFDKMMSCAIEYEESGFIAGFKTAMALLSGNEEYLPQPTEDCKKPEMTRKRILSADPNNSTPKQEKQPCGANAKPQKRPKAKPKNDGPEKYIDSLEIAKMFECRNSKVVDRCLKIIVPSLENEEDKKGFFECAQKNSKRKQIVVVRLDHKACQRYCEYMKGYREFTKTDPGIARLKDRMREVFCGCCVA